MKLTVPLINFEDVEPLIWCGADEFFCGINIHENTHPFFSNLNRRTKNTNNFNNPDNLKKAVSISHNYNIPVYLTLNEIFTKTQYKFVNDNIKTAEFCGVDGLIISDFGLLLHLYKTNLYKNFKIIMGTGSVNFNVNTILFYKKYGAKRVVLSRKLYPEEMIILQKNLNNNDIEIEAFMEGDGHCPNLDGLCNFLHNKGNFGVYGGCSNLQLKYSSPENMKLNQHIKKVFYSNCKICFIYDLIKININAFKVLGREDDVEIIKKRIKLFKKLITVAKKCESKNEFVNFVQKDILKIQEISNNEKLINCKYDTCYFKNKFLEN